MCLLVFEAHGNSPYGLRFRTTLAHYNSDQAGFHDHHSGPDSDSHSVSVSCGSQDLTHFLLLIQEMWFKTGTYESMIKFLYK